MKVVKFAVYLLTWCCFCCYFPVSADIKINLWNIQIFGQSKMDKPEVVEALVKVIVKYDLVLIQEIRNSDQTAIYELLVLCNKKTRNPYRIALSPRLGRSSSKEQYAFFYRESKVQMIDEYLWPDEKDVFEREPWVVKFSSVDSGYEFGFIPCHIDPDDAVKENDHLVDVYDDMVKLWNLKDFIIGGDLNFDCSYVTNTEKQQVRLRTDPRFTWLISDTDDTTVSKTHCAYDRLITAGDVNIPQNTVSVYRFDEAFKLSQDLADDISDHYPITAKILDPQNQIRENEEEDLLKRLHRLLVKKVLELDE